MQRVAIVGAGLAGVSLARAVAGRAEVTLLEKARGPGGRMATRHAGPFEFDHGAQYFTVRSERFRRELEPFLASGLVRPWPGRVVRLRPGSEHEEARSGGTRFVASPRMNALVKELAADLDVRTSVQVASLEQRAGSWHLSDAEGGTHGPFDWVVSSAPSVQTAALAPTGFSGTPALDTVRMRGNFTLMLGFETPVEPGWSGAFVEESLLGWIAINGSKPGRPPGTTLVVQSSNDWAENHLEDARDAIQARMMQALKELTGIDGRGAAHVSLHRWRYADTPNPAGKPFLMDESLRFASCGDWCLKGRVEAAFTSGTALAGALPV